MSSMAVKTFRPENLSSSSVKGRVMDGGSRVADARLDLLGSLNTLQNYLCRMLAIPSGDERIELLSLNSIGMDCFCLENFLA